MQDVILLEEVYLKLRPWMNNHPNLGVFDVEPEPSCPKCGSTDLHWRGYATTQAGKFHRFQCQGCGGWGRSRFSALDKEEKLGVMANVQ